jgi:hypothetical protein
MTMIEDEAIIPQSRMYARSLFLLWLLACGRAVAEGDRYMRIFYLLPVVRGDSRHWRS